MFSIRRQRKPPFMVGQKVFLNKHGMETIYGIRSDEEYRQSKNLTITRIRRVGPKIWAIEVDQPLINRYMLSHLDVSPNSIVEEGTLQW